MTTTLRDGTEVEDPRLDRLVQYDERSRNYQVRQLLETTPRRRKRYPRPAPPLDQGAEGACVGFSTAGRLNTRPYARKPLFTDADAREMYFEMQRNDQWPGGAYEGADPQYDGTSVVAGMQTAQRLGHVKSYYWVGAGSGRAVDDLVETLRHVSGVIMGTRWHRSMFRPRPSGLLEVDPGSELSGYHAWHAVDAVHVSLPGEGKRRLYGVGQNSWGADWGVVWRGVPGCFFFDIEVAAEYLLENEGEGAVPVTR